MDYIAGDREKVDADLRRAGFDRIGVAMYRKGERRIRWVSGRETVIGIEGAGRKFIVREGADVEIRREAALRRFEVTFEI